MSQTDLPVSQTKRPFWLYFLLFLLAGIGTFAGGTAVLAETLSPDNPLFILLISLTSLLTLGGTAFLLGILPGNVTLADLGLRPFRWQWRWLWISIGLSVALLPLRAIIGLIFELLLSGDMEGLNARAELLQPTEFTAVGFLISLLAVGLIVPVAEELFFRGLLHTWLQKHTTTPWPRILLTSSLFGLAHYDSLGVVASSFVLGVLAAILYERTRSIIAPILVHMTTNSIAMGLLYLAIWASANLPEFAS